MTDKTPAALCGRRSNGFACELPAGTRCPDCSSVGIDYPRPLDVAARVGTEADRRTFMADDGSIAAPWWQSMSAYGPVPKPLPKKERGAFDHVLAMIVGAVGLLLVAGAPVTYTDATGKPWCAHITTIAPGAGAVPVAWLTIDADPRRVVREPVTDLALGCSL